MNSYELQKIIENIKRGMSCPHCGEKYSTDKIHFIGQLDIFALLSLECQKCGQPSYVNLMISEANEPRKKTGKLLSDISPDDLVDLKNEEQVDADDILDVHSFLVEFNGDFENALK